MGQYNDFMEAVACASHSCPRWLQVSSLGFPTENVMAMLSKFKNAVSGKVHVGGEPIPNSHASQARAAFHSRVTVTVDIESASAVS